MRVELVRAWPRRFEALALDLPAGATVGDAIASSGWTLDGIAGMAVFGQRVDDASALHEGDRLELLRPLQADPKDLRRRRASRSRPPTT